MTARPCAEDEDPAEKKRKRKNRTESIRKSKETNCFEVLRGIVKESNLIPSDAKRQELTQVYYLCMAFNQITVHWMVMQFYTLKLVQYLIMAIYTELKLQGWSSQVPLPFSSQDDDDDTTTPTRSSAKRKSNGEDTTDRPSAKKKRATHWYCMATMTLIERLFCKLTDIHVVVLKQWLLYDSYLTRESCVSEGILLMWMLSLAYSIINNTNTYYNMALTTRSALSSSEMTAPRCMQLNLKLKRQHVGEFV